MSVEKRWIAVITWIDGDVIDADEISVFAESAEKAESMVRAIWSATNRAEHPHCRIEDVEIFTPSRLRALA